MLFVINSNTNLRNRAYIVFFEIYYHFMKMKVATGCKQIAREVKMATDSMYLDNLEEYVNDEGKIVSVSSLFRLLIAE